MENALILMENKLILMENNRTGCSVLTISTGICLQADVAALMASLIGVPFPLNSVVSLHRCDTNDTCTDQFSHL